MKHLRSVVLLLLLVALVVALLACDDGEASSADDDATATDDDDDNNDDDDNDTDAPPAVQLPPAETYGADYIAVGSAELLAAAQPLLDFHAAAGMNVWTADLAMITARPGPDVAAQVRAYLQTASDPGRSQYVLLVGSNRTIPARYVDPDPVWVGVYAGLTDVYYSDLDGDFDADGDSRYGEWGEDIYDATPEMFVGRLPFDDAATIAAVAEKIVAFASADADYKHDTLLAAANIAIPGDAAIIMELIERFAIAPYGFGSHTMYEDGGFIPPDEILTHKSFVGRLRDHPPGFAVWASHGDAYCSYADEAMICSEDAVLLPTDRPGIMASSGCDNADLSKDANLGAALLSSGAVAFIGSTTNTDPGKLGEGSLVFMVMVDRTLNANRPLGEALAIAKGRYMDLFFREDGFYDVGLFWMNFFGFTLLGDPAMRYWAE
jgi:Peptidase family C25